MRLLCPMVLIMCIFKKHSRYCVFILSINHKNMTTYPEYVVATSYFLYQKQPEVGFECLLNKTKEIFDKKGVFIGDHLYITNNTDYKEFCWLCKTKTIIYGSETMGFCAKCILPKDLYNKYILKTR